MDISEKAEPGPMVAPGVFTVTPTVLAYAIPGTARASRALTISAFPAAGRRRSVFRIRISPSEVDLGGMRPWPHGLRRIRGGSRDFGPTEVLGTASNQVGGQP
ncbi:hypothetical protein Snoj_14780 [Streptomyces nojiriensis]|uniref:Uncharacterized protein n=1 Tax=Streptomyces nojiriensis TaxID=66374 RepID=A0ABQ3SI56_9ACTN|nr:hypothetical protein GCM10010205_45250 [Streptomyces nojiriensis]GHI67560.1 hypothetical protein Snoj_14780 [Streptomyces nojiriensis]